MFLYRILKNGKTAEIVGYKGEIEDKILIIPKSVDDYLVTSIASYAFRDRNDIEKLYIPENIDYIGEGAFMNCCNLTIAYIVANIKIIQRYMFLNCRNLVGVFLSSQVIVIREFAFNNCDLLQIVYSNCYEKKYLVEHYNKYFVAAKKEYIDLKEEIEKAYKLLENQ